MAHRRGDGRPSRINTRDPYGHGDGDGDSYSYGYQDPAAEHQSQHSTIDHSRRPYSDYASCGESQENILRHPGGPPHDAPLPPLRTRTGEQHALRSIQSQDTMARQSPSSQSTMPGLTKTNTDLRDDAAYRSTLKDFIARAKGRKNRKNKKPIARVTWKDRLRDNLTWFYQIIIIQTILRQKPLPPSEDGRHVPLNPAHVGSKGLLDERSGKPYVSNFIRSNRYTIFTFLPKQLLFQFSKLGNFYFLIIAILQMIPGLSTVGRWTTIAPLALFVSFSMAKEGFDDWRRYRLDKGENRSLTWVLARGVRQDPSNRPGRYSDGKVSKGKGDSRSKTARELEIEAAKQIVPKEVRDGDWIPIRWQHIQVGDIIRLRRDDAVPADMAILHATGPNGIAYIDTMALDGETNLKSKQASALFTERCGTIQGLCNTQATVVSEDPNIDLYSYDGRAVVDDERMPLTINNVVYRGSTLRNTREIVGLVINSGEECKIRMNANKNIRTKKPAMQSRMNGMIMFQILGVCLIAGGLTVGYYLWKSPTEADSFYLVRPGLYSAEVPFVEIFFGYVIMFNTLIPLSLYVSLEIIKIGQLILMQDAEMYDPVSDTPAVANTMTIVENLGQVGYVFSDKTGTLTENLMRFRKLSVAGVACLHDMDMTRDANTKDKKIAATEPSEKRGFQWMDLLAVPLPKWLAAKPIDTSAETFRGVLPEDAVEDQKPKRPDPKRMTSTGSVSQWTSSVRPNELPEMKTEDLLDYIQRNPDSAFGRRAKWFLLCIALCHTCLPETNSKGEIDFQAASPDELALVEAARDLGFLLIDRSIQTLTLQTTGADGRVRQEQYQVLDVIEFSSKRKRMSIIIRMPDGRICVFCKGADNVIRDSLRLSDLAEQTAHDIGKRASIRRTTEQGYARQRQSVHSDMSPRNSFGMRRSTDLQRMASEGMDSWVQRREREDFPAARHVNSGWTGTIDQRINDSAATDDATIFKSCFQHTDDFASEGLRTLLYGYRFLEEDEYARWKEIYREAETSLVDRQKLIEDAGELIEQNFELAGATAIEDKLQDGVPETVDKLRRANIKVWMLTGDKRETAINIGHSARVCKPYSEIFTLDSTLGNLRETMNSTLVEVMKGMLPHSVLVVDGGTLAKIEADEALTSLFYDLVIIVDSVICCRASPSQKANLVKTIRRYVPKSMTLAIGDGANDIGMIQEAHVGVGVSGREGLQAARISDYSIAQFRFLQKLLFVHGRWNYMRTGRYVLATFWKEILFYITQAHFQPFNGYTGTSLYESWSIAVFNVLFTSLPVILLGIFDKDLMSETLLLVPELYTFGQKNQGINYMQYLGWSIMAVAGSCIIYYFTWICYTYTQFDSDNNVYAMGMVAFTVSVVWINVKLL